MENSSSAITAETKNVINPRAEIDTSAPFESVKEAVDMFSGRCEWIHQQAAADNEATIAERLEEQAAQLERDLIVKEKQTLRILKELEAAKAFVEDLKLQAATVDRKSSSRCHPTAPRGLVFMDLNHAKSSLTKTTSELDRVLASVELLNEKISCKDDGGLLTPTSRRPRANFESDQFTKMTEASRYEVMKAMSEIERMKNSIRMAEMRLNAAKKMEEAARAVKAIATAESETADAVTLSLDEYRLLTQRLKQAEDLCNNKKLVPAAEVFDEMPISEKQGFSSKFRFRNSYRSSPSKVILQQDDVVVERHVEEDSNDGSDTTRRVSLSQMLKKQSRLMLHQPTKGTTAEDGGVMKRQYFLQRKKFGFIQVPIPSVQTKKM